MRSKGRKVGRQERSYIGLVVAVCLLGVIAVAGGFVYNKMNNVSGGKGARAAIDSVVNPRGQFPADKSRLNLLLIGKDYSYTSKDIRYTKDSRADSIVFASLDLDTRKVSLLSIPRDTRVVKPDKSIGKINGIYSNFGRDALIKAVTDLLGVAPDHYIAIKPDALKAIVDTLGGVEVETIDFLRYDDSWGHLHIDLPKGRQTINGDQAVGFARFREVDIYERDAKGNPVRDRAGYPIRKRHLEHSKEEGDPRRMARQQQLIRAMAKKATSVGNLFQLDHIVNTGLGQLETDLDQTQIFAIAALFRTINPDDLQAGTLEGKGELRGGAYFFIPDEQKKTAAVDWLIKGDETAANRLTVVSVENATQVPGAARRVADLLKQDGFDVKRAGNVAPGKAGQNSVDAQATRILYKKASVAARARHIAELIGGGTLEKEAAPDASGVDGYSRETADVTIILGRDLAPRYAPRSAQR